ncbi:MULTISPECIES: hypothetical protein [unclassified Modestobacter]
MPRRVLARLGFALLIGLGAVLAAIGAAAVRTSGLVAVALAAVVSACVAVGVAREAVPPRPRRAVAEAGWRAAAGTVGVLLVLSGSAVVAGGTVTTLLAGCGLAWLVGRWLLSSGRRNRAGRAAPPSTTELADVVPLSPGGPATWAESTGPESWAEPTGPRAWAASMSVPALGQEWVRTSAALGQVREPRARQELVRRRQEALDELERRDPAGFARWLAEGATVDSDPAVYVSGDPAAGSDAA